MIGRPVRGLALVALLTGATPARAAIVHMAATIDGEQSVPGSGSTATGAATITVDTAANTLTYHLTYTGLSSPEIAAHIHGMAPRGEVAFPFLYFFPLGTPKDGVWNYSEDLEGGILSGQTYINIHTQQFNNGEIRGQIEQTVPIGERVGWAALAVALLGIGAFSSARAKVRGAAR